MELKVWGPDLNWNLWVESWDSSRDPYQIPKAGVEIAPLAGLASININRSVGPVSSTEFVGESTLGGVLVYAIYQALLTGLRTEAMRSVEL